MTGHTKEPEIKINLADTWRNTEPPFLILFRREGEPMFGVSCKGEITVSKHYPPDEVAQAVLDALSGALAQIYERERAALDALIDAAEWIAANYENGDLNHIDFRLEVKHRVDAALTNFRGDTQ